MKFTLGTLVAVLPCIGVISLMYVLNGNIIVMLIALAFGIPFTIFMQNQFVEQPSRQT